jgi:hypothetical protein
MYLDSLSSQVTGGTTELEALPTPGWLCGQCRLWDALGRRPVQKEPSIEESQSPGLRLSHNRSRSMHGSAL